MNKQITVEQIENLLAGYNCCGCGYSGCRELAEAIKNGEATPELCAPNSIENTKKLNELLKNK